MSNTNTQDGGPAFPNTHPDYKTLGVGGMTLRDYFAAAAMQGQLANDGWFQFLIRKSVDIQKSVASHAYGIADAMLAERAKQGGAK